MSNTQDIKEKIKEALIAASTGILVILTIMIGLNLSIQSAAVIPDYANVYTDTATMRYYAPDCVPANSKGTVITLRDARALTFTPDPECRDEGYFQQVGRGIITEYLEQHGLLSQITPRWNTDGSWNW